MATQDSYYLKHQQFANMRGRGAIMAFGDVVIRPLVKLMEFTRLYLPFQRIVGNNFPMNDQLRNAFGDYQATEHDIFVTTYSKSGTYWMLQIAHQIAHQGQGEYIHIHDVIPWPDCPPTVNIIPVDDPDPLANSPTNRRVIKTHLAWDAVPYHPSAKYISVIRDPKDVFVSSYYFIQDVAMGVLMPSVDIWLELYLSSSFMLSSWAEHVAQAWAHRDIENHKIFTFQDMKKDPSGTVRQVADFIDIDISDEAFKNVVHLSSFDYMKQEDARYHPGPGLLFAPATGNLIRKGKTGGSGEMLTPEQQNRIDEYMQAELERLGSDFPYKEMFLQGH